MNLILNTIDHNLPKAAPTSKFSAGSILTVAGIGALYTGTLDGAKAGAVALGYTLHTNDEFNILLDFLRINLERESHIIYPIAKDTFFRNNP